MWRLIVSLVFISWVSLAQPAHAYLDPGNGSMILQVFLGGAAGLAVLARYYWNKVGGLFSLKRKEAPPAKDESSF